MSRQLIFFSRRCVKKILRGHEKNYSSNNSGDGGFGTLLLAGVTLGGLALLSSFSGDKKNDSNNAK